VFRQKSNNPTATAAAALKMEDFQPVVAEGPGIRSGENTDESAPALLVLVVLNSTCVGGARSDDKMTSSAGAALLGMENPAE